MRHAIAIGMVACALGCSQRSVVPVVDVGDPQQARLYVEVEASQPSDKAVSSECVAPLVYEMRRYSDVPAEVAQRFRAASDAILLNGSVAEGRKRLSEIEGEVDSATFMPFVYLHIGERFAEHDANLEGAASFFREALRYPPDQSPAYFYAALRLAQVEQLRGAHASAMAGFARVAKDELRYPSSLCMTEVAARAREGFVVSYALVGEPSKAFDAFRFASGSLARTLGMLVRLADLFAIRGSEKAYLVMRDIVSRRTDAATCSALRTIVRTRYFLQDRLGRDLADQCVPR